MGSTRIVIILAVLSLPFPCAAADPPALPDSFLAGSLFTMTETPRSWTPDNMYEHVNGEAELLIRYGARGLAYAVYETEGGASLTVDFLDMVSPVNAFGLYSLYAGCDGEEYSVFGATVLSGQFTSFAIYGRYFMRIDLDTGEGDAEGRPIVESFLEKLAASLPAPGPMPLAVGRLKQQARKPCEVGYHPQHVDYDLEAGPGYLWIGPDGGTHFISFFPSPDEAQAHATVLRGRGVPMTVVWGNAVAWPKVATEGSADYLKGVLRKVVKW